MTAVSCLAIGLAFAIAVGLLTLAGVLLGWFGPRWVEKIRPRRSGPRAADSDVVARKNGRNGGSVD